MSSHNSTLKTLIVATLLCIVCATLVSSISVALKERQLINKDIDKKRNILLCAGLIEKKAKADEVKAAFEKVTPKIVDLQTGEIRENFNPYTGEKDEKFNPEMYDQLKASKNPALNTKVENDKGSQIKARAKYALIYLVKKDDKVTQVILPIKSYGLWSTMLGFLALDTADTSTIKGFAYYSHGETPGLGGEVDNPKWKGQWPGKKAFNENWKPAIHVIKGKVNPEQKDSEYKIDGLSGATITSNGISTSLDYWLSESGFGLFLSNIREKGFQ
ncbi:Na(+)-translocating NADH-quinone reductase subunit C [Candidatus Uabimicrobium sp. HlEnr_7]|uniref:Na(+)-translocating NADH-quinone reductase subunit C n=1 Tax=Candidatus Uabimicrobium helgolandensis TaxID=3095367 RepID=UPI00355617F7